MERRPQDTPPLPAGAGSGRVPVTDEEKLDALRARWRGHKGFYNRDTKQMKLELSDAELLSGDWTKLSRAERRKLYREAQKERAKAWSREQLEMLKVSDADFEKMMKQRREELPGQLEQQLRSEAREKTDAKGEPDATTETVFPEHESPSL